ncbi:Glycosyltransferase involved in cell wall bisynthesis [Sphingobacterium nematocida]|uniref:Glycosyltransferase involved in cell wall bisynthesis n=1 Tax=Sphingobacterium nematocida TaxID=1513896 RepID=A0A1T5D5U3_9SPHI|nr:glycosyltransferase family 2 protein [Sphingobacterium nematocida]SKB67055.1 Glycosyltransferase involved in cell wall bisynthesis [Sphingobacterium nematocida]
MKISIITIVYNNVRDIEYTISSVLNQSYPDIEYIVIDGASTDGTLDIINRYKDRINTIVSEKDAGIYDAMNKGLALATGDYVLFLNSGDELYDNDTIRCIVEKGKGADIIYGETKLVDEQRHIIADRRHRTPDKFDWQSFRYGMNICHQAIYIKRSIAEPYDLKYHLSADIDWIIRAAKKAKTTQNVHNYVARYLVGGMSQKRHRQSLKERYQIFKKHYGCFNNWINHGIIALRLFKHRMKHGKTRE